MVKNVRRLNDNMILVSKTSHKQNHCENHKADLNENLPTLRIDSLFALQFSNSVSKTREILLFTINIIEMFELHPSRSPMRSAEYPLKFLIIIHN